MPRVDVERLVQGGGRSFVLSADWCGESGMQRFSTHNLGTLLAILAACIALLGAMWPGAAPQSQSLSFWLPLVVIAGCLFLLAAIIANDHQFIARALLLIGGVGLLGSAMYFGAVSGGGGRSALAVVADLAPGLLAIMAGLTIGPIRRGAAP